MARALWSGSLSFGLVNIPVSVVSAVRDKDIRFNLLHDKDGGRIQFRRVCSKDGKEVPNDHIVKGYDLGADQYVTFTEEELEALAPGGSKAIEIEDFVDQVDIDPVYYDKPYILVPGKNANKAYALLLAALQGTDKVGIARMTWHGKQQLVAIRAKQGLLCLETMQFSDEVVPTSPILAELELPAPDAKQLKLAQQLIASLEAPFDPERYKDEHREAVQAAIDTKAKGHDVVESPQPAATPKTMDLMAALEASLQAKTRRAGRAPAKARPASRPASKRATVKAHR